MKILTNKNGIALVAVLTLLLVLTLFLPVMFTMSESATKSAMRGQDTQRASYLARTMVEMAVAAFQDVYDAAEDELEIGVSPEDDDYKSTNVYKLECFYNQKTMEVNDLYMYRNDDVPFPENRNASDYDAAVDRYEKYGLVYSTKAPNEDEKQTVAVPNENGTGTVNKVCTFVGMATCNVTYDNAHEYYKTEYNPTDKSYKTLKISKSEYDSADKTTTDETAPQYSKIEKKNVEFVAAAKVNGKGYERRCTVILPTKPSEQNWIVPASIDSNQIFVDSSKATSVKNIKIPNSFFVDKDAVKDQKMYIFSCIGNMVITTEGMTIKDGDKNVDYNEYLEQHPEYPNQLSDFSLGVYPKTTTRDPENDPNFACVATNNMRSWSKNAQKDNFVAFTATNGIQVDMPVNLLINPCRTGRIGDGIDRNQSLYKLLYFQAPTIVFNGSVNSFISLYQKNSLLATVLDYNAFRMSSIILTAPQSTPYSYYNKTRGRTVKAGMVYFMEDAYVWLVPLTENGSNWKTQTVYYKGKDIILYKFANAGDVYLFNNEVETTISRTINGERLSDKYPAGFSMTNYFMDVLYSEDETDTNNLNWWQFWSWIQEGIYGTISNVTRDRDYVKEDLKYVGNVRTGGLNSTPVIDDFYVVWDS